MQLRSRQTYRRSTAYKSGSVFSIGPTTVRYLILMLLAVFSVLFLIEAAQGSDGVLELRRLEDKKKDLNQELTTLQVNASRLQSVQALTNSAAAQGLVPVEKSLETITVGSPANGNSTATNSDGTDSRATELVGEAVDKALPIIPNPKPVSLPVR